ncbi:unnamed protein product [Cercopithifilaria johnstoni]|uniref:Uncharacterized protein n=1 Tax=Cercopithifilaria johnstoni TaxID=2874296 RepID=A0A8J2PWX6_9BILA|nr:unnamed protein product [Cercopithifilaria johnstoni]
MAALIYDHFGMWSEDMETTKPAQEWCCNDYDGPIASSLFGLCLRYFALRYEEITGLPKSMIQKIEMLRHDMNIVSKMHQTHVIFKLSWIGVGKYGNVDWRKTYAKCYREMPPDDFFIFAAINGIATRALWRRLDELERRHLANSYSEVIRYTATLMFDPAVFNLVQYKTILVAAQNGWPGAVCAWIGMRNNTLSNVDYLEELIEDFNDSVVETPDLSHGNNLGKATLLAIREGQYHLLRYLPNVNTADSFDFLFTDGRVSFDFFQQLINFPATENLLNDKLSDYLESIARALLTWMPDSEVQRLQQKGNAVGDIKSINCINRILNGNDK